MVIMSRGIQSTDLIAYFDVYGLLSTKNLPKTECAKTGLTDIDERANVSPFYKMSGLTEQNFDFFLNRSLT